MQPINDVVNGYVLVSHPAIGGKLRNRYSQQPDTAPLPLYFKQDGQDWSQDETWTNFPVWDALTA
jgi:hypothetical protein